MKRSLATSLAFCLAATTGLASAQNYNGPGYGQPDHGQPEYGQAPYGQPEHGQPGYGQSGGTRYDYARVLRVDPVLDPSGSYPTSGQRCYERQQYAGDDRYDDRYNGGYNGGYNGYGDTYRRDDGYYDQYGNYRRSGSQAGATMATVIGGIVGAAIGSQVGGGSARYATSAIGSMVGGMAGRSIYEQRQRARDTGRVGTVTVCDPVPVGRGYDSYNAGERAVNAYDVTYEYGGQQYTARTSYHPGDRIRVRVDVRAE